MMLASSPTEFKRNYLLISEYSKPKQQRSEVTSKQELTVNWGEVKKYIPDDNANIS